MEAPNEFRDPHPLAGWLNKLLWFSKSNRIVEGVGYRIASRGHRGTILEIDLSKGRPSEPGVVKQFRVKSVQNDHLVCREFSGTTEGSTDIEVAKKHNLRRTGWHGVTVVYGLTGESWPGAPSSLSISYSYVSAVYRVATITAGSATSTEHQVILPRYVPDVSVIFASKSENGTGVATAPEWIELDHRSWGSVI